jgi:hypothetical protein
MMATKHNQSALLKSKVDQLEHRLRELEASAAEIRSMISRVEASPPLSPSSFLAPHPAPERRSPSVPILKKNGQVLKKALPPPPPKVKVVKIKKGHCKTKFSAENLAKIQAWVAEGLGREQIAERLGTTLGSLQVSCSRKGVSLWAKNRGRRQEVVIVREEERPHEIQGRLRDRQQDVQEGREPGVAQWLPEGQGGPVHPLVLRGAGLPGRRAG